MIRSPIGLACAMLLCACGGAGANEDAAADAADAQPAASETGNVVQETEAASEPENLDAFPAAFRGRWDSTDAGEYACSEYSDSAMQVEPGLVQYYEGSFRPKSITKVSENEVSSEGTFEYVDERSAESYNLKLSDNGKRLTLSGDGFDPFVYRKCSSNQSAASEDTIPADFHGEWAWQDRKNCPANPANDLIVAGKAVTLGGKKSKLEKFEYGQDSNSITVHYRTSGNKPAKMFLDLIDNGQRIAFGEPGATGMLFARCP